MKCDSKRVIQQPSALRCIHIGNQRFLETFKCEHLHPRSALFHRERWALSHWILAAEDKIAIRSAQLYSHRGYKAMRSFLVESFYCVPVVSYSATKVN